MEGFDNRVSSGAVTPLDHIARLEQAIQRGRINRRVRPPFPSVRPVRCESMDPMYYRDTLLHYLEARVMYEARFPDMWAHRMQVNCSLVTPCLQVDC